ncbi:MAG: Efflux ABC transporter, permease protein [uncultured Friedmanniella sp.]|uniref:Efflux ABC transporter, permease protein n=1 Tax=uncultured Friedmanniella sp. TaxID=335381 RepID=A0A6J4K8K5_9ACTN|nr:MAG: Efflux ABC transporter, permease protein [uncultured Friedmanniella sp.]
MSAAEVLDQRAAAAAPARSPLGWLRFLRSELGIIFGRRRNLAGIGVLAVVPVVLAIAVKVSAPSGGEGPDFVSAITGNGLFVAFAALTLEIPIFLPLAVGVIAGDSVAGEANIGTLRYLLTIPAGRTRLLAVKFAAIVLSALVAVLVVAAVGTAMGLALFGGGPMTLLSGTQTSMADGVGRLLLTCLYLTVQLSALGAIGLFISTLTEQPIGATVAVVLVNVMMFVLDSISQLAWLHPWLLTHWWTAFGNLLRDPIATADIGRGLLTAAVYAGVFWLAAWARFSGKDVTS